MTVRGGGGDGFWLLPLLVEEAQVGTVGVAGISLEDVVCKEDVGDVVLVDVGYDVLCEVA